MRPRAALAAGLLFAVATGGAASAEPAFVAVTITGSTPADIACRVVTGDVAREEDHSGQLPVELRFEADSVSCAVTADGPVVIEAEGSRGSRSRARSSGGRLVVTIAQ